MLFDSISAVPISPINIITISYLLWWLSILQFIWFFVFWSIP